MSKQICVQISFHFDNIGAHDIESEEDLMVALARLISCNLDINRWFIKLNSDLNGESLVIIDASKLPIVRSLREEQAALLQANHNNVLVWYENRIQMNARKRIAGSFHHHRMKVCEIIRLDLYPNWIAYANKIRHVGCLIEAEPPCTLAVVECVCLMEPTSVSCTSENCHLNMNEIDDNQDGVDNNQHTGEIPISIGFISLCVII